eukprot:gene21237-biopygen7112
MAAAGGSKRSPWRLHSWVGAARHGAAQRSAAQRCGGDGGAARRCAVLRGAALCCPALASGGKPHNPVRPPTPITVTGGGGGTR